MTPSQDRNALNLKRLGKVREAGFQTAGEQHRYPACLEPRNVNTIDVNREKASSGLTSQL